MITKLKLLALSLLAIGVTQVSAQCNLSASFNVTQGANGQVTLVSTSTGTSANTSYLWSLGNGMVIYGNSVNYYIYPASGNYTIRLITTNTVNCVDTAYSTPVAVNLGTCVANPSFSLVQTNTPGVWNAITNNPGSVAAAVWYWGDGGISNTLYTSHQYANPGTYDICLSLTLTCGHSAATCDSGTVYRTANSMVTVNVLNPKGNVGLKEQSAAGVNFMITPNPGSGLFNINLAGTEVSATTLEIRDLAGRSVYTDTSEPASNWSKTIDLSAQPAGIYFARLNTGQGIYTKKIVILK